MTIAIPIVFVHRKHRYFSKLSIFIHADISHKKLKTIIFIAMQTYQELITGLFNRQ